MLPKSFSWKHINPRKKDFGGIKHMNDICYITKSYNIMISLIIVYMFVSYT